MKLLRALLVGGLALVVAVLAIGLFLPETSHVERSITTSARPEAVYPIVSGFRRFNEWSPWADIDPRTRYTYGGPDAGVGARMEWHSDDPSVGSGSQEVIAVEPGRSVTIRLDFGQQGRPVSKITLVPEGSGTRIVWSMDMDFSDNLTGRYFGPFLDRMVGPDYERGLAQLKRLVEVSPPADAPLISPGELGDDSAPAVIPD